MTASAEQSQGVSSGYYVARAPSNNSPVAYDWFEVKSQDGGILIDSIHNILIAEVPQHIARFALDADWTPRRLMVEAGPSFSARVEFGESEVVFHSRIEQEEQTSRCAVGRRRAYFMMNGGLYFPLHVIRRFDFAISQPQRFDIVPEGECEAVRLDDSIEAGETLAQLEMRLSFLGMTDIIHLWINSKNDLVRYRVRNQNLIVTLEDQAPSC